MVTAARLQEIKEMSSQERATLVVALFEKALERAQRLRIENAYSLVVEVELFVNRYCTFAGWDGEDGAGQ